MTANVAGLEDNTLYLCKDYKGDPGGNFGELVWVRNHPMLVQRCPVKCEVTGQGTNDHCSGEQLFHSQSPGKIYFAQSTRGTDVNMVLSRRVIVDH